MSGRRAAALGLVLLPLILAASAAIAAPAAADPDPGPTPCSTPSAVASSSAAADGCPRPTEHSGTAVGPPSQAPSATGRGGAGILGPFTVKDRHGTGIDHYDISGDDGGMFNFAGKFLLLVTNIFFYVGRVWTGFTAWLTDWALHFGLVEVVARPAQDLADSYRTGLVGPLGLRHLLLTLAGAWSALLFFRGRVKQGVTEAAVSLLISAAALTVLADPVGLLLGPGGLMSQTRDVSVAVASVGLTHGQRSDPDPNLVSRPVTDALVDTLVRKPHEILEFGTVLDDPHHPDPCLPAYNMVVALGPWYGNSPFGGMTHPWTLMARCNPTYASYNRHPTMDRMFGALFAMVASIVINVLVDLVDIGLAVTPVVLAFDAVLLVAALTLAILPGAGRALLYRRIGAVAGALASVIAATAFLAIFLTTIQAFLVADLGVHLAVRFLVVDIVAIAGWRWRRSLTAAARHFGGNVGHRMEASRAGGAGHGWVRPAGIAALGGVELTQIATQTTRSARRHAYRAQLAAYRARRHLYRGAYRRHRGPTQHVPGEPGNRLLAVLDATGPGRLLHRTGALGTAAGLTALKYTAGAPVYVPRASRHAREKAAHRSQQVRSRLVQARAFTAQYKRNLASAYSAANTATRPARNATRAATTAAVLTAATTLRPTPSGSRAAGPQITAAAPLVPDGLDQHTEPARNDSSERVGQRLHGRH